MPMIRMGIDPSINCTGICIYDDKLNNHTYYMIVSKCTKKMREFRNDHINIIEYNKRESNKGEYHIKEYNKSLNIYDICCIIRDLINLYNPDIVQMEGVSYGSRGSAALVDLAGLNFAIRMTLSGKDIQYNILAPTSIKKFAVGNGSAEKDVMIASWKKLDKNIACISEIKLDDLADSYFISHFDEIKL
jgi:Holliday junction resolvasome RuvABC endonuclease subunit